MSFNVRGYEVHFPHQSYGVQISFMEKMLWALAEQGNALLEAPTGCGKTLSLLCAALAWQTKCKKVIAAAASANLSGARQQDEQRNPAGKGKGVGVYGPAEDFGDDAYDYKRNAEVSQTRPGGKRNPGGSVASSPGESAGGHDSAETWPLDDNSNVPPVPTIFFATRTHSQIVQIVPEIKRTAYKPRMATLAAKQHYCINKAVLRTGRVDDEWDRPA